MLSWDDVLVKAPSCVMHESEGETVVVLPEAAKYVVLNETGARIVRLADGNHDLNAIAEAIAEEFDADADQVRADVFAFAQSLLARGVLIPAEPAK